MSSFADNNELSWGLQEFSRAFEEYDGALNHWTPTAQALGRRLEAALSHPVDAAVRREIGALIADLEGGNPRVRDFHLVHWAVVLGRRLLAIADFEPVLEGGPGAKRIAAPVPFALSELEAAIRAGIRPGPQELREGLVEALNAARTNRTRPAYEVLLAAALLTGDPALRRDVITLHQGRDLDAYHQQKASGMSKEDLGDRPTEESSARIVGQMMRAWLEPVHTPLSKELLKQR